MTAQKTFWGSKYSGGPRHLWTRLRNDTIVNASTSSCGLFAYDRKAEVFGRKCGNCLRAIAN